MDACGRIEALTDPSFGLPGFPANPHATYTNMIDVFLERRVTPLSFRGNLATWTMPWPTRRSAPGQRCDRVAYQCR